MCRSVSQSSDFAGGTPLRARQPAGQSRSGACRRSRALAGLAAVSGGCDRAAPAALGNIPALLHRPDGTLAPRSGRHTSCDRGGSLVSEPRAGSGRDRPGLAQDAAVLPV